MPFYDNLRSDPRYEAPLKKWAWKNKRLRQKPYFPHFLDFLQRQMKGIINHP